MTTAVFRDHPNCLGAKVDRIVFDFSCRYCGAPPGGRCHTKSGAVDPCYHMLRHDDASYAYDRGYRTEDTREVPGFPSHASYKWKRPKRKRKPKPKTGVLTEPPPMTRRMLIS
jgi:hypothetical protein